MVDACTAATPNFAASTGGFGTIGGQFYSPNGQPWIAHGVNVPDFDMATPAGVVSVRIRQALPGMPDDEFRSMVMTGMDLAA